jgi:hypothetical protein
MTRLGLHVAPDHDSVPMTCMALSSDSTVRTEVETTFLTSSWCRPLRSTRPIAVQPSIFPIPCLLLNPSVLACYSFPCLPNSNADLFPPAHLGERLAVYRLAFSPLPVIQLLSFQTLTDSFAPWTHNNHFVINTLRTLSIAMGVYTPLMHFSSFFSIEPALLSLLESHCLQTPTHQPLSNHIVTKTMGWGHCFARVRRLPRLHRPFWGSGRGASRRGGQSEESSDAAAESEVRCAG